MHLCGGTFTEPSFLPSVSSNYLEEANETKISQIPSAAAVYHVPSVDYLIEISGLQLCALSLTGARYSV